MMDLGKDWPLDPEALSVSNHSDPMTNLGEDWSGHGLQPPREQKSEDGEGPIPKYMRFISYSSYGIGIGHSYK